MNIFLGILALALFVMSLPYLFYDPSKMINKLSKSFKEFEDAEKAKDNVIYSGTLNEVYKAREKYNEKAQSGCSLLISSCLSSLIRLLGNIVVTILEIVVILMAILMHVGNPVIGYIALAIWIANLIIPFIYTPKEKVKVDEAVEEGKNYSMSTGSKFLQFFSWLPDLYGLYIFLVVIGVLI